MNNDYEEMGERLLRIKDVANILGISARGVYRLKAERKLKLVHVGRAARIALSELRRYIASIKAEA